MRAQWRFWQVSTCVAFRLHKRSRSMCQQPARHSLFWSYGFTGKFTFRFHLLNEREKKKKRTNSHLPRSWELPASENMCEVLREMWAWFCLARSALGLITHGVDLASLYPDGLGRGVNLQRPRKCHNHSASIKSTYSHCMDECNMRFLGLSPNLP